MKDWIKRNIRVILLTELVVITFSTLAIVGKVMLNIEKEIDFFSELGINILLMNWVLIMIIILPKWFIKIFGKVK